MREETRQDVLSAGELGTKYDEAAKTIWRNREILAPLLKYSLKEMEGLKAEEIIPLIDPDSISGDMPVSDLPPAVAGRATEHTSVTEKPVAFDLRFNVKNPRLSSGSLLVMIHVDLEFQNKEL